MKNNRPLILISNDDGYYSKGLESLVEMIRDMAEIVVCSPDSPRSGYSCAFSATLPLQLELRREEEGLQVWSCNGTPVDCVKMALGNILSRRPDMVIGGINHGDNASVNTHYSGTMGVTLEGCMKNIPSVAFSLCSHEPDADFSMMTPVVRYVTKRVLDEGLPAGVCLNINFPVVDEYRGVKVCRMAKGIWENETVRCLHPRGYDYFWMMGNYNNSEPDADDTDNWALRHGYVAITPTQIDVTNYPMIERMKAWEFPV
ncbi:MAG: 5'/3'-nucleotidase SurE [Prevotella sp.]|uniref:5'/3'-nucleotidase SurE n=1 Tax=Prevotella sp. TaxID=59823 RepID=UPI002A32CB44|nr:5'/3'-nucleotidase SurE [Prevotella sp.]MDD7317954.1 5'/3'-nucleotidase SurE [Prevotellaceae bacterium]MDY4020426.1 5'/3'-nucleotidase SurE [Prevotella sp.]